MGCIMENSTKSSASEEKQPSQTETNADTQKCTNDKGGWISSLLILGTSLGLNIALGAWYSNLMVFLINEFNVNSIHAAQINNVVNGLINFFPVIASIFADSIFGPFFVVVFCSVVSLLGLAMLTLVVTVHSLRPTPCNPNNTSTTCTPPSTFQHSFLYIALTLASLGQGGARFLLGPMGADQLHNKPKHQETFFNWFVFNIYLGWIIGYTILIYIEDSVSWVLSFGLALLANVIAILIFLSGSRIYQKNPPKGSPFTSLARVLVAAIRKMRLKVPRDKEDCYHYESLESKASTGAPSKSISFLNQAALMKKCNNQEQCTKKPTSWSLCTVEEVEDLKKLIKILPIWSSGILLSTPTGIVMSLTVLMALVMDRNLGPHFKIPAGSFYVISTIVSAATTPILDRFLYPVYKKLTSRPLTPLQCIGVGHVANILSMLTFALIEHRRLSLVHTYRLMDLKPKSVAPLSALWLVFPLAIRGVGIAFYFPKETTLFYKEFPSKLRSTSSAMLSLQFAVGYYVSSGFITLVGRLTSWLPDDINHGRVDNVYWVLTVVSALNFGYFLICAALYKYNNPDPPLNDETSNMTR